MHNVRQEPLNPKRGRGVQIGFVGAGTIERTFVYGLYAACWLLVVLSVLGTFYGGQGLAAPLTAPLTMIQDAINAPARLLLAIVAQIALTLTQYGARAMARRDRRWWLLYLAALSISVYYNLQAYYTPITAMANPIIAWVAIIGGDVIPEFVAVKRNE